MRLLFLVLLSALPTIGLTAQPNAQSDSVYAHAKALFYSHSTDSALVVTTNLIKQFPAHHDYRFLYLQILFSTGSCDTALRVYHALPVFQSWAQDDLDLLIRIHGCLNNYDSVVHNCQKGIAYFPNNRDFYFVKKAEALLYLEKTNEALTTIDSISLPYRRSSEVQYIRNQILQTKKRRVILGTQASFINYDPELLIAVSTAQISFPHQKITHAPKLNIAYGIVRNDYQVGYEMYRLLGRRSYINSEILASPGNSFFPQINIGTEVYRTYQRLDFSLGLRYLYFQNFGHTWMGTGHLSRTGARWGLGYRPHVVLINGRITHNETFWLRYNFWKKESYLRAEFQFGTAPFFNQSFLLDAIHSTTRVGIGGQIRVQKHLFLSAIALHEWEEFFPDTYRNRLLLFTSVAYRF